MFLTKVDFNSDIPKYFLNNASLITNPVAHFLKNCFTYISHNFIYSGKVAATCCASIGSFLGVSTTVVTALGLSALAILVIALITIYGVKYYHKKVSYYNLIHITTAENAPSETALHEQALTFARTKLSEHPHISPYTFREGAFPENTFQPVNPEIARLTTLYWDVYYRTLIDTLKKNKKNPWQQKEVIEAADACMKISYAIGMLTLDELEPFSQQHSLKGHPRSPVQALTEQDSYQYGIFYYCIDTYHALRESATWGVDHSIKGGIEKLQHPTNISKKHSSLFYERGTIHNQWNTLYNSYGARVRTIVTEQELSQLDHRKAYWLKSDTAPDQFVAYFNTN